MWMSACLSTPYKVPTMACARAHGCFCRVSVCAHLCARGARKWAQSACWAHVALWAHSTYWVQRVYKAQLAHVKSY